MSSFTTEAFSLLGVGLLVIGLRITSRLTLVGFKGLKADDYLMLVAAVIYSCETAAAYTVGAWWHGLANNGMDDEARKALNLKPDSEEFYLRVGGSKTQLFGWSFYTLLLWILKLCVCIFYGRLTSGVKQMRIRVRIGYGIIATTYIATELSILLGCHTFSDNWRIYPDPGNYCQPAISHIDLYVTVVLNVVTDMYLMSIPLPMLWTASLPKTRKYLLCILFSGAVFIMAAGILRCVLILQDPIGGAQQAGSWAVRETFVAVVIGNIPLIYPLYRRMATRITSSFNSSRYRFGSSGISDDKGSYKMNTFNRRRNSRRRVRSHNAIPTTFDDHGSAEQIIPPRDAASRLEEGNANGMEDGIRVTREVRVDGHEHEHKQDTITRVDHGGGKGTGEKVFPMGQDTGRYMHSRGGSGYNVGASGGREWLGSLDH